MRITAGYGFRLTRPTLLIYFDIIEVNISLQHDRFLLSFYENICAMLDGQNGIYLAGFPLGVHGNDIINPPN
jgi:hypothetical protein